MEVIKLKIKAAVYDKNGTPEVLDKKRFKKTVSNVNEELIKYFASIVHIEFKRMNGFNSQKKTLSLNPLFP